MRNRDLRGIVQILVYGMAFALLVCAMSGCAGQLTEQQEYDRDDRRVQANDMWRRCLHLYESVGVPTYHVGHEHDRRTGEVHGGKAVKRQAVRDDIHSNNCKQIIRQLDRLEQ